jgi:hypothetical protein
MTVAMTSTVCRKRLAPGWAGISRLRLERRTTHRPDRSLLMTNRQIEEVARRFYDDEIWFASPSSMRLTDSWTEVVSLIGHDPEAALSVIFSVISKCSALIEIARVGTGALETILAEYPHRFISAIVARADHDLRIRQALSFVAETALPEELKYLLNKAE